MNTMFNRRIEVDGEATMVSHLFARLNCKCGLCGNIVEVMHGAPGALVCCNEKMALMTENTVLTKMIIAAQNVVLLMRVLLNR